MPIGYCRACGAFTTGKFCSNCGKKVSSDFETFQTQLRRRKREFRDHKYKENGKIISIKVAIFAHEIAQAKFLTNGNNIALDPALFNKNPARYFGALDSIDEEAQIIYDVIMWQIKIRERGGE